MKPEYERIISNKKTVLLYTGWDRYFGLPEYFSNHPVIDIGFCDFLVKENISALGLDMPSPDNYPYDIHVKLLKKGIFIIENLINLQELLEIEKFELISLPLKIKADSSPSRVIARIL
jgi:kynurenine formamidase